MQKKRIALAVGIIIILAIITRLSFLDLRPLHHDEGVNYFFAKNLIDSGRFNYDPLNYHGPSYFFALFLSFLVFGVSEFSLRLPAALFGIILVLTPLFFRLKFKYNKYLASIFLILSPSIMYYSRYSIHESLFVLLSLLSVYTLTQIIETKSLEYLPFFAFSLALAFATKETVMILSFILFAICIINYKKIKQIKFKNQTAAITYSILIFLLIYIALFTSFLINLKGLADSFKGYFPWTERGITELGHQKPFFYYLSLLVQYEMPLLLLSILGIFYSYKNRKNIFLKNISIWLILIFLIYSSINYKTPWLIINITVPLALMASIGLESIKNKKLKYSIIVLSLLYLSLISIFVNFIIPWQSENQFAYVHTDKDILNLVREINENKAKNSTVLVVSDSYWPLPFYLDGKKVEYLEK